MICTAKDIMTADTLTVAGSERVADLARRLVRQGVSNAPVVNRDLGDEILIGFISEQDILGCIADGRLRDHPELTARQVMRANPVTIDPGASLESIASMFTRLGYRHLPVVGPDRVLLGIVSRRDVLAACLDERACEPRRAAA